MIHEYNSIKLITIQPRPILMCKLCSKQKPQTNANIMANTLMLDPRKHCGNEKLGCHNASLYRERENVIYIKVSTCCDSNLRSKSTYNLD